MPSRPTRSVMMRNSVNTDHHIPHIQLPTDRRAGRIPMRAGGSDVSGRKSEVLFLSNAECNLRLLVFAPAPAGALRRAGRIPMRAGGGNSSCTSQQDANSNI